MKKLLGSLLCLAMVVGLTGCGDGGSEREDKTTLRTAKGGDIEVMDPAIVDDSVTANVLCQMYEGLYKLDKDGNAVPNVAVDMPTISEDGLTYTIKLNEGIKWSDGQPLKAGDFVYAWKRAAAMGTGTAYYSQFINKIKNGGTGKALKSMDDLKDFGAVAKDDTTIVITLKQKCAYFTSLLTNTVFYPVRQDAVEKDGANPLKSVWSNRTETPVNGAFYASKIDSKDEVVLTKNKNYRAADEVSLETISIKVMSDSSSQTSAFQSGEIDWADTINLDTVNADESLKSSIYAIEPFVCNYYVLMNAGDENTRKELKDPEIRAAFAMAINRENVLKASGKGDYAYELNNLVPKGIPDTTGDFTTNNGNKWSGGYNLAEAQKIMKAKGYSESKMLKLSYSYNDVPMHKDVAQAMQASLKEAYIDLELKTAELQTFFSNRDKGDFETCRHAMTADFLDPMAYLSMYYGKDTAANTVDDKKYEDMIDAAEKLDGADRFAKLAEAEKYLVENHYVVPLFGYTDPFLKATDLEVVTSSPEGHFDLTRAKFK